MAQPINKEILTLETLQKNSYAAFYELNTTLFEH